MFGRHQSPSKAYKSVGYETEIDGANPHRLILMLFDGALMAVASAKRHMEHGEIPEKGAAVSQAITIIGDGLRASLDVQAGGELAEKLGALYDYMCDRLFYANVNNSTATLEEVSGLLGEIKGAWAEIGDNPAVHPAKQDAA